MNAWIKFLAAALLFALWGALVFTHQADPKELVMGIVAALTGLGVFHAATNSGTAASSASAGGATSTGPAEPTADPAAAPAPSVSLAITAPAAAPVTVTAPQVTAAGTLQ
ncbi:hypothetical protein [Paraburkholderia sp. Ac-20347]|uniref:hypothetical protein n=1 Tax=Paraburkholderia sp. Ac-20347 TaxID=2703892 RepID=UPI00197E6933|nr:hypothetical protein [Paraburkholderia sp. Ac-20347]MBN3813279.1 hypothetical protein [Paraburkholderia sp. Ac-20347]